jgi:uncharacterized protein (DUF1800 family)
MQLQSMKEHPTPAPAPDLASEGSQAALAAAPRPEASPTAQAAERNTSKRLALAGLLGLALSACGDGGDAGSAPAPPVGGSSPPAPGPAPAPAPGPAPAPTATGRAEASRFLGQASFGATDAGIDDVVARGLRGWIDWQFTLRQSLHVDHMNRVIDPATPRDEQWRYADNLLDSFYIQALRGADQLRQRVVYALAQIFVVSQTSNLVYDRPRGHASYLDLLGRNAFGNLRTLLEEVATHPSMGQYLSHLANRKEDAATGRVPDENFAREVMQLFSIGLLQLDADGSPRRDGAGRTISTYSNADVSGMAKVFTGWSWAGPDTSDNRFRDWLANPHPDRDILPMQPYPQFHSTSEKRFLGVTVPAGTGARDSLRIAIDTLFAHPNTGPFIGRQLIQRLVTSNPSPAYVSRVAAAFADDGSGVRGDMKAVIRAILLDDEARLPLRSGDERHGKVREPVLRLTAWARAFGATSSSGEFRIRVTSWPGWGVGQTPLRPPSVFNFFRPGYVPPGSAIAAAGRVAPEFQIIGESQVTAYLNFMAYVVENGVGNDEDVRCGYPAEVALASDPDALIDRVDLLLTGQRMGAATRAAIRAAIQSIPIAAADAALNRARTAVMLALCCPEFAVQV